MRTHKSNAKTKSVQSMMSVGDAGGSAGDRKFVKFVEFIVSIESLMVLATAKIDDVLSERFATRNNVRSKLNNSILTSASAWLLFDTFENSFRFSNPFASVAIIFQIVKSFPVYVFKL